MSQEVTGVMHLRKDTQVVSDKFQKREFVIKTDEQYPQYIKLEFTQDKCNLLDNFGIGRMVTVGYNLRGNLSKDGQNAFNTLQAWSIK